MSGCERAARVFKFTKIKTTELVEQRLGCVKVLDLAIGGQLDERVLEAYQLHVHLLAQRSQLWRQAVFGHRVRRQGKIAKNELERIEEAATSRRLCSWRCRWLLSVGARLCNAWGARPARRRRCGRLGRRRLAHKPNYFPKERLVEEKTRVAKFYAEAAEGIVVGARLPRNLEVERRLCRLHERRQRLDSPRVIGRCGSASCGCRRRAWLVVVCRVHRRLGLCVTQRVCLAIEERPFLSDHQLIVHLKRILAKYESSSSRIFSPE